MIDKDRSDVGKTGILFKQLGRKSKRYVPATLAEASLDTEGFYLKIDAGKDVQIYVCLSANDALRVVNDWGKLLK